MLLSAILALFGLSGCVDISLPGERPISGGVTDKTDPKASKEIDSEEITEFYADICLLGEWTPGRENQKYVFEIKKDEAGVLTASEQVTGLSRPADEALLTGLQEIIEEQELAKKNGVYRVTAGLPPEYQKVYFKTVYASGETIEFTVNNEPEKAWRKQIYLLFADWFQKQGDDALVPPKTTGTIDYLEVCFKENDVETRYMGIHVQEGKAIDGETYLFNKSVYNYGTEEEELDEYTVFPDDFYDRVSEILAKYDLRTFDIYSAMYGFGREEAAEDEPDYADLQIHVRYDDDRRLNIDTNDDKDKAYLKPLLDEWFAYFDSLFSTLEKTTES